MVVSTRPLCHSRFKRSVAAGCQPANRHAGSLSLRKHRLPTRSGSILLIVIVLLVVLVGIGAVAWFYFSRDQEATAENILLTPVFRGPYEHIVLEQGQVESSSNVEIRCEVKSRSGGGTEIISVVDEGSNVKKGDKLVELDKSALDQDLVQQQIVCNTSHALVVQAENTLQAAEISRIEYLEGTFRQEEQTILSEIFVAEENLRRAQLSFQSTERLAAKGIVTALQLEGDQFAVDKAKNELEVGQTKLEVLRKYTREKTVKQFDSDIATAKARWEAEKKSDQLEDQKLKEIEEQIEKCTIFAPEDGQVVYASDHNRWGGSEFVVEPGASVRERQVIIRLPDPAKMQVKAKINESRISSVRAGLPVAIEFDAVRDQTLRGEVTKVNQYAEPDSWRSGNIKEYAAFIKISDPPPGVRSGMNAEVRIYVEQLDDALQVPVTTLYETKGHYFCLVKDGNKWETREVRVGSSNDTFMTIEAGLKEGELVAMNPRSYPDKLTIPDLPDEEVPENGKAAGAKEPRPKGPPFAGPKEKPGGGADPTKIFSTLDQDSDGTLSADELKAAPADQRGLIATADADGDGTVSLEEFTKAAASLKPGGANRAGNGGAGQ